MKSKNRVYPESCLSRNCGKSSAHCPGCQQKPALDAFQVWVKENDAVVTDPIWCPNVYTARE
jgi:hypothetical protein